MNPITNSFSKLTKRTEMGFDQRIMKRTLADFTQRLMKKRDEFQARLMKRDDNSGEEGLEETEGGESVNNHPKRYGYRLMKRSQKTGWETRLMKY